MKRYAISGSEMVGELVVPERPRSMRISFSYERSLKPDYSRVRNF